MKLNPIAQIENWINQNTINAGDRCSPWNVIDLDDFRTMLESLKKDVPEWKK